jgi:hypothetical protein
MIRPSMKRPMFTSLLVVLGAVALVALLGAWGLRALEPLLIYHPTGAPRLTPRDAGLPHEEVRFATPDGETLQGWWLPAAPRGADRARPAPGPVLLFFHGNAGSREHRLHNLQGLHRAGIPVFIFDYRGFGGSSGRPGEGGLIADGVAAHDWLRSRAGGAPIVFFGRSLGGAVAARVALQRPPAALILESTFTDAPAMAGRVLPLPGIGRIVRARFDALGAVRRLAMPLLMIHGEADEVVPLAMGRTLFQAAAAPDKTFRAVPGGMHNDTYVVAGEDYWRWIADFVARAGK